MTADRIIESTVVFRFSDQEYENARDFPTYYRALNREPRHEHPFNSYEDILRQPELVRLALAELRESIEHLAAQTIRRGLSRVLLSGVGSSYNVGASAAYAFWQLAGMPTEYVQSAEALAGGQAFVYDQSLVIGLSASGNTQETVEHVDAARQAGAYTLACVNLDHTRLTRAAHDSLVVPGGFGLVWDFPTRLAVLYLLALEIARQRGGQGPDFENMQQALYAIPDLMDETFRRVDRRCKQLASEISSMQALLLPATGEMLPLSWEIALRFEEMAHIPSRGGPLVEYLHGSIGMLSPVVATLIFAPPGSKNELHLRAAKVTQTVKTPCYAILDENDLGKIANIVDGVVRVPATTPLFNPLIYLLPGQLMAYYAAISQPDGNPDAQRTDQPRYARAFDIAMPPKSH